VVDLRVESADDAARAESSHALEARRGREAHQLGEVLVRGPCILLDAEDLWDDLAHALAAARTRAAA